MQLRRFLGPAIVLLALLSTDSIPLRQAESAIDPRRDAVPAALALRPALSDLNEPLPAPARPPAEDARIKRRRGAEPAVAVDLSDAPPIPRDEICRVLARSADTFDLPLGFFSNIIWQESRLRPYAISPVGAQGIAQFMPRVAQAMGLRNPFDPLQALPFSARLLRELIGQYGNLGVAAAAYNGGTKRVDAWLAKRSKLADETISYVQIVTGRPAEYWRKKPKRAAFPVAERMPCRRLPVFAQADAQARTIAAAIRVEEEAERQKKLRLAAVAAAEKKAAAKKAGKKPRVAARGSTAKAEKKAAAKKAGKKPRVAARGSTAKRATGI